MSVKLCPKCGVQFEVNVTRYEKKYCSRKCANFRIRSEESKKNISIKMKELCLIGKVKPPFCKINEDNWETKACLNCGKIIKFYKTKNRRYCSRKCGRKSPKLGGYRFGSTKSKSGYYKGIRCDSTYELAWVIYRLDHNMPFRRFENILISKNGKDKYLPDFLINENTIVEIKGFEDEKVKIKTKIAEDNGYSVILLKKKDLLKEFEWIEFKYGIKNIHYDKTNLAILYDDYKPLFTYKCDFCKNEFNRNKKIKTNLKFCSRKCVGKYVF